MFINEYNQTYNPDFRMIFPTKEEAKKNAIADENLKLLRALNEFKRIDGFTRYGIIVKESLN